MILYFIDVRRQGGDLEEYTGQGTPDADRASVVAWPLLGREDGIATECTGDEQLPVFQGQMPLHKDVQ